MGDAEIIPLGTRGRPGRGTGSSAPSAATRTLAGAQPRRGRRPAADGRGGGGAPPSPAETPRAQSAGAPPSRRSAPGQSGDAPPPGGTAKDGPAALGAATRDVSGERWERRTAELLAFMRRRLTGDFEVDEFGFDAELTNRLLLAAVRPLKDTWFRVEVRGAENIPAHGGALLVSNHSGTIPLDSLMTMAAIHDTTGRDLRPLGADLLFRLPLLGPLARSAGATLACAEDAQRMLSGGQLVGVWPEGFKGIGKPYSDRYKLQRFGRGGFVSAAIRTGVPIIPCSVVGAEEIYPLIGNVPALARLLGLPYLPITPFFPWLGPLGLVPLPSKWYIALGKPIRTDVHGPAAADDPMLVLNLTEQVRETIQQTLYTLLTQRRSVFH